MNALILDTETTGKGDPVRPVEIAWARLLGGAPPDLCIVEEFAQRYRPERQIEYGAMAMHHISEEDLGDAPAWHTFALPDGVQYLIGHQIDYDWQVIGAPPVKRICTLALSRYCWPAVDSHTQGALLYFLDPHLARIELRDGGRAHTAAGDLSACHAILAAIVAHVGGVESWEELWQLSEQARVPTTIPFGRHKGTAIRDLPRDYREWMVKQEDMDPYLVKAVRASLLERTR